MLAVPISKSESTDTITYPLSIGQQTLWSLCQDPAAAAMYNGAVVVRVLSPVNVTALRQTFQALVDRHDALRTTIEIDLAGRLSQTVHARHTVNFVWVDAADWDEDRLFAEAVAAHNEPFDLEKECSIRVRLFTQETQRHLLLVSVPHIVSDGWSMMRLLMAEMKTLYPAYCAGLSSNLPPLKSTYADYVAWQTGMLAKQGSKLGAWWKKELGRVQPLVLPTDYPRPPVQTFNGRTHYFRVSAELTAALKQLSKDAGGTLYMTLLAAFQLLLYRYTGQNEIIVGTPAAGRVQSAFMDIVGYFSNFLPMRSDLIPDITFSELLERIKRTAFQAQMHQAYPFSEVVRHADFERDPSYPPLMQVGFNFMNALSSEGLQEFIVVASDADYSHCRVEWGGLLLEPYHMPQQQTIVDLTLELEDGIANTLAGVLKYNADLFDTATIERMAQHFQVLLEAIVSAPYTLIQKLNLLTAHERRQLVHEWNDTAVDYGEPQTIHALFEQQVAKMPDAIALVFEREQLTYTELNAKANQLAHHLIALGVQPDTLVAVLMERSVEMVVSLLAVLKAGGAYVPIDPGYPAERIQYMLTDSEAQVVLKQTHLPLDGGVAQRIDVDTLTLTTPHGNPQTAVNPQNLAYCIYTSGSTGRPKGVLIEHGGAFYVAKAQADVLPNLTTGSRLLQLASLTFDAATAEIMMALLHGAALVLAPADHARLGAELGELLVSQRITHVTLVPSVLQTLPDMALPDLQVLITAGEACSLNLVKQWSVGRSFFNFYGPTESPIWTTSAKLQSGQAVHIGQPIPNRRVYILDESRQVVPLNVAGELYIGGSQLARGYLNRPKLTAECFIEHEEFGRLYRTGDLCRWLPSGDIEYIGRADYQVKIRGFRIELGEIENALLAQEAIQEAVVVAREEGSDKRLVAYLVGEVDIETVRQQLEGHLPDYMIPAAFVALPEMPLNPNGKLDRRALPAPSSYGHATNAYVAPRSWLEIRVAEIWQRELQLDRVGIDDNFFEIGGHSLLLIKVQYGIRKLVGEGVRLADLLHHQTIRTFCQYVLSNRNQESRFFEMRSKASAELVTMQKGSATRTPLLCLPGRGGGVTAFIDLVSSTEKDLPIYGLQYRDLAIPEDAALPSRMSDFLAYFISPLTALQTDRQHIIGHSSGGALAFLLAIELQQMGQHVPLLGIMDNIPPVRSDPTRTPVTMSHLQWSARAVRMAQALLNVETGQEMVARLSELPESAFWEAVFDLFDKHSFLSGEDGVMYVKQRARFFQAMQQCLNSYELGAKYAGQLILFRATKPALPDPDPLVAKWKAVCEKPIVVHHLPCIHGDMGRAPYINQVGELFQQHICE